MMKLLMLSVSDMWYKCTILNVTEEDVICWAQRDS